MKARRVAPFPRDFDIPQAGNSVLVYRTRGPEQLRPQILIHQGRHKLTYSMVQIPHLPALRIIAARVCSPQPVRPIVFIGRRHGRRAAAAVRTDTQVGCSSKTLRAGAGAARQAEVAQARHAGQRRHHAPVQGRRPSCEMAESRSGFPHTNKSWRDEVRPAGRCSNPEPQSKLQTRITGAGGK